MRNGINGAQLARELGVSQPAVWRRLKDGQSVARIRAEMSDPTRSKPGVKSAYTPTRAAVLKAPGVIGPTGKLANGSVVRRAKANQHAGAGASASDSVIDPSGMDAERTFETIDVDRAEAERRLSLAKARKEELLVAEKEGKLIEFDTTARFIDGMISSCTQILMRIPSETCDRLASFIDPVTCRELLELEIGRALGKLSKISL